jgi:hypothetical protein
MNNASDKPDLLDEVLSEAAPADFRGAMLDRTLRAVRRRRQFRQMRQVATLLVVLAMVVVSIWRWNLPQKPTGPALPVSAVVQNYKLVRTRPLPGHVIVTTQPLISGLMVSSEKTIGIVETRGDNYRVLDDAELFALLGSRPAVLIRTGPHSEELVFANPEDEKGFPLN